MRFQMVVSHRPSITRWQDFFSETIWDVGGARVLRAFFFPFILPVASVPSLSLFSSAEKESPTFGWTPVCTQWGKMCHSCPHSANGDSGPCPSMAPLLPPGFFFAIPISGENHTSCGLNNVMETPIREHRRFGRPLTFPFIEGPGCVRVFLRFFGNLIAFSPPVGCLLQSPQQIKGADPLCLSGSPEYGNRRVWEASFFPNHVLARCVLVFFSLFFHQPDLLGYMVSIPSDLSRVPTFSVT